MNAALDARWDSFLTKIRERFDVLMRESVAGCAALLAQTGGDTVPVSNAWTGMRMRALALGSKVSETWSDSVQDMFHDAEAYDAADRAWARGEALIDAMEIEIERTETAIFADAIRSLLAMAAAEQAALRCSQCGAELVAAVYLQSVDLPCKHCGALVTVEPGPRARMAVALSHHVWRQACWDQWLALHHAQNAVRNARTATLAQLQAWESAEIEYWTAWLAERAKLMPETTATLDKELRQRMHQFYELNVAREKAWIDGGRPRRIPN